MKAGEMLAAMNRHEKTAWLLLAASGLAAGLLGWTLFFADDGPETKVIGPAWWLFLVGYVFFIRRDRTLAADERDKAIQAHGARAGYAALMLMLVVASVVVEGFGGFVASRTGHWLGNFLFWLVCILMSLHAAVMVWHYGRDRR
jgi:hypothetical protein